MRVGNAKMELSITHTAAPMVEENEHLSALGVPTAVELFTHPICNGCQEAVNALSKLARSGAIDLSMCNLGTAKGRKRADSLGVSSVPTVRIGDGYEILMRKSDLRSLIERLSSKLDGG